MSNMPDKLKKKIERAEAAREKKPALGPEVDTAHFNDVSAPPTTTFEGLPESYSEDVLRAGVVTGEEGRTGTFFQMNEHVLCARSKEPGLEVLSTTEALEKYDWMPDYLWEAVQPDADRYTALTALRPQHGYFIRAEAGAKSSFPIQACLFIGQQGFIQRVHNVIIAEENSELHIITGCTTASDVTSGFHVGVSEFYVKRGAKITFTMVHNWAPEVEVRPRTGVFIEEGGTFISNYICLRPVHTLQLYPTAWLKGPGARVRFQSILYAQGHSLFDVGSRAILQAPRTSAEIVSRVVAKDSATVIARGHIRGEVPEIKGHLECQGLLLSPNAVIQAIPELDARAENVEMSHEAAVGKIAEEEILYLMARGLSTEEATALIVRGFLDVNIEGLPPKLAAETKQLLASDIGKFL
jgi:Fe-S cluster assembly scaffold protein SufB